MKMVSPKWFDTRRAFWSHVLDWQGSSEHKVTRPVIAFGLFAAVVWFADWVTPVEIDLGIAVAPYEFAGTILGAILVLRTNAGLDRWWEARKLWGGILNQSRNLAVIALANGPEDPVWRRDFVGWVIAFGHVTRWSLRSEPAIKEEVAAMVGAEQAEFIAEAPHMPLAVTMKIACLLREARDRGVLDPTAFLKAEEQRGWLMDELGGCERILKTPLAAAFIILIRRFIVLFLLTLPFALLRRVEWQTPFVTMLVAYPILALDHIADDLQRPFWTRSINHLPLDDITTTIEANLLALVPVSVEETSKETISS